MWHIPEAELHAYLDQALPRLRCVEIESHLAECTPCRTARDEIAALRDRTTAMLARLAPRRTVPPPLTELRRRAAQRASERARIRQRAEWAASVVVALGVGWAASYLVHPPSDRTVATRTPPAPVVPAAAPLAAPATTGDTVGSAPSDAPAALASAPAVPAAGPKAPPHRARPVTAPTRLASVDAVGGNSQPEAGGVSQEPSRDVAPAQSGVPATRGEGPPITEAGTQAGDSGHRPLMVVAQQLASGEVIRTVQGPVSDVSVLLGSRPDEPAESAVTAAPAGRPPLGSALADRHGDRMFGVTGPLPSDSLRAMMRRLNLMLRVR